MNSEITKGLLESAIEIEEKKLARTGDDELRARIQRRIDGYRSLLNDLFPEPDGIDLSDCEDEILQSLERAIGRGFQGQPLATGIVREGERR